MHFEISPKQKLFMTATSTEVLFGGAAGGGKSHGQLLDALRYALEFPTSKQLILRRSFPELERSLIRAAFMIYPKDLYTYNGTKHTMTFNNGSMIDFGHCENDTAVIQYQSAEYDCIRFDELTHFTEYIYLYLLSRLRGANDFPKQMKSSTNPGGVGHTWVKNRFITLGESNVEHFVTDEFGHTSTRIFIPSMVRDNTFLMEKDPVYAQRLNALPEKERRALRDGDWDIFEGQYFTEFKRELHVVDRMEIMPDWKIYRAFDYGLDMLACLWIAMDYQGTAHIFRELYEPGLIISEAANRIKALTHEHITATYAPPDMWHRRNDTGRTAADIFNTERVPLTKAPSNRVHGWLNVKEYLQVVPDEFASGKSRPRLLIDSRCKNLIRCIPELQTDKLNPNDCATSPHEITHAPDALRYFCAARTARPILEVFRREDDYTSIYNYGMEAL